MRSKLRIVIPGGRSLAFCTLGSEQMATDELLTCSALLNYAMYTVYNIYAHNGKVCTHEAAFNAMSVALVQGVKGHVKSLKFLTNRWEADLSYIIA